METKNDNVNLDKRWVNMGTGEILDNVTSIKTEEQVIKEKEKRDNQVVGYKYYMDNILPMPSLLQKEYGNYIHTKYNDLLNTVKNDCATAFRFVYICTYLDYDSPYPYWNGNKMKPNDLVYMFNTSRSLVFKIRDKLLKYNLIFTDSEGYIYINQNYCYRGNNPEYKKQYTRFFNTSIRELYNKCRDPREHKMIGKLIVILPYVNVYHNIICLNPLEKDMEKLQLPNTAQMEKILQVGERNSPRALKDLFNIIVNHEHAVMMITDKNSVKMYAVNPRIYYGGVNVHHLEELAGYFKAKGGID